MDTSLNLAAPRVNFMGAQFDQIDQAAALARLQNVTENASARLVVTPNADHLARLEQNHALRAIYDQAWMCLCDSKLVWLLGRSRGWPLHHVTGSDLTRVMFETLIAPGDHIALVVANAEVARALTEKFPGVNFRFHVPPAGLLSNPAAREDVIAFMAAAPTRFHFLAVGSPQSEIIASEFCQRPGATGAVLCIGASLEFITGQRKRAPLWMQRCGLEWLHRIGTEPRRLFMRYVLATPPIFRLYLSEWQRG